MGRYVKPLFSRFFQFLISLLTLILLSFGLLKFFPGSPFNDEQSLDPLVLKSLQESYGLQEDLGSQFLLYIERLLAGDLGSSLHFVGRSVGSLIFEFGKTSAFLGVVAFSLSLVGAFVYMLLTRLKPSCQANADQVLLVLMSVPTLALAPFSIWFFGFYLQWVPVALLHEPLSFLLPIVLLSFKPMVSLARILSSSLDSVMQENYIQTARSLGFSNSQILRKWALRNALTSFLSQAGPLLASLISGSFLIEILFAIPGLGFQFVESVLNRDWPLILGLTLFYGGLLMIIQLITDLMIVAADPKARAL